jgi:MoaA/NifB/PqqE/SkfB family radical SAM enzyme
VYTVTVSPGNIRLFLNGHRRTAVFALSPQCNCKCTMCGMWRKPVERISYRDCVKIIDFLLRNRFLIVYFTGGEPTLHPDLPELVKYAHDAGMITTLTTNGRVSERELRRLKENGLQSISVSLDHFKPSVCETIRGVKDIMKMQIQTIENAKKMELNPYALAYLSPQIIHDGVINLISYANGILKVPWGFCFPTEALNSFSLRYEHQNIQELREAVQTILSVKLRSRGMIVNTYSYITDALRFLDGRPTENRCRSGQDVLYIDWHGDAYPCFLKDKIFNVLNDEPVFLPVDCDQCLTNCFREPSYLGHITIPLLVREITH